MVLKNYFTADYFFGAPLPQYWNDDKIFLIAAILIIAIGAALWFFKKATSDKFRKMLLRRWYSMFFTIGILALLWSAMRYELVPYIATRVVVYLIFVWGIYWAGAIIYYTFTGYKHEIIAHRRRQEKDKYI